MFKVRLYLPSFYREKNPLVYSVLKIKQKSLSLSLSLSCSSLMNPCLYSHTVHMWIEFLWYSITCNLISQSAGSIKKCVCHLQLSMSLEQRWNPTSQRIVKLLERWLFFHAPTKHNCPWPVRWPFIIYNSNFSSWPYSSC